MSAQRIDVLASLDDLIRNGHEVHEAELRAIRAAVAELIEADKALDAAEHALAVTDPQTEDADTMESMRAHRDRCRARRRAALARVQGGAA